MIDLQVVLDDDDGADDDADDGYSPPTVNKLSLQTY